MAVRLSSGRPSPTNAARNPRSSSGATRFIAQSANTHPPPPPAARRASRANARFGSRGGADASTPSYCGREGGSTTFHCRSSLASLPSVEFFRPAQQECEPRETKRTKNQRRAGPSQRDGPTRPNHEKRTGRTKNLKFLAFWAFWAFWELTLLPGMCNRSHRANQYMHKRTGRTRVPGFGFRVPDCRDPGCDANSANGREVAELASRVTAREDARPTSQLGAQNSKLGTQDRESACRSPESRPPARHRSGGAWPDKARHGWNLPTSIPRRAQDMRIFPQFFTAIARRAKTPQEKWAKNEARE